MKRRILFVDDEENVLRALHRSLRRHRTEWEMVFASGGRQALELADQEPFDVVVADMCMSDMNGAELLKELQRRKPAMIRIVLSGRTDKDTIMNAAGLVHRYLTKPCEPGVLEATLIRVLSLQELIGDERLQALVGGLRSLPTLPAVYLELNERLGSESTTVRELGEIVVKDPPLTAKLLQLVNSVFYGLNRSISDPVEALTLLGVDTLRGLVLAVGVFSQFDPKTLTAGGISVQAIWDHSLAVATLAKEIASAENAEKSVREEAFLSAFLHDIGMQILIENFPREYADIETQVRGGKTRLAALEQATFGADHGRIGGYLLGLWGLADSVVEAVSHHHQPTIANSTEFSPLTALYVAEAVTEARVRARYDDPWDAVDLDYLQELGLDHRLEAWRQLCPSAMTTADGPD